MDKWAAIASKAILARESGPETMVCARCGLSVREDEALYRCFVCYHARPECSACLKKAHHANPFHRIERWTKEKRFWERMWLSDIGLEVDLGHNGERCRGGSNQGRLLSIIHEHGITSMKIHFCNCIDSKTGSPKPLNVQLIEYGLFPATWERPRTLVTTQCLKRFNLLSLQSQVNAWDFVRYLVRSTDNVDPDKVQVCVRLTVLCGQDTRCSLFTMRL